MHVLQTVSFFRFHELSLPKKGSDNSDYEKFCITFLAPEGDPLYPMAQLIALCLDVQVLGNAFREARSSE